MRNPITCGNSYTIRSGYITEEFLRLDELLACKQDTGIHIHEPILADHVENMVTKLGFVLLSRDNIAQCTPHNQTLMNYHVSHFIYDTKAFLDAISVVLNYFYYLQFITGDIDLKKGTFKNKLESVCPKLGQEITNQEKWIQEVIEWREAIIHRLTSPIIFYGSGEDMKNNKLSIKMPVEPISLMELQQRFKELKQKYGKVEQEILPFCDRWIEESKKLFNLVCESLVKDSGGLMNITPRRPKSTKN